MPQIVKFYLGAEPILKHVTTWRCPRSRASRLRAGSSGRAGGEGSPRLGRLRHDDRPERPTKATHRGVPRQAQIDPEELHRAADPGALDLPDLRSRRASPPAMSTCGRSC